MRWAYLLSSSCRMRTISAVLLGLSGLATTGYLAGFSVDRIDRFELRRQYVFGHYLPKF
jgi:hypothetical protein